MPEGTEVCWSVEGAILEESSACGNLFAVKALATGQTATIKASVRYAGACDNIAPAVITRTIDLGTGVLAPSDITITGADEGETVCPGRTYTFKASPGNYQGYQWSVTGIGKIVSGQGTNAVTVSISDTPSAYGTVSVAADNGCGYGHESNKTLSACSMVSFSAYPVPSDDYLNLRITSFDEKQPAEEVTETDAYEVKLYNDHSLLIRQMKTKSKEVKIDVSDLPAKVYLLQVLYKGMSASQKVMIGKL